MYHRIEFAVDVTVDLEVSPKYPLERLQIRRGERLHAQLKPYTCPAWLGPAEVYRGREGSYLS
jgi:hypothetical protein